MNRLILHEQVLDGGLVGVRLSGPIDVRPIISQGCRLVGERFVVTRSEGNLIHELGGAPALERLQPCSKRWEAEDRSRAHRALHLGIVIDEHQNRFERGDFLIRNLLGADQTSGAIAVGEMVQEGQTVQFQLRDAESQPVRSYTCLACGGPDCTASATRRLAPWSSVVVAEVEGCSADPTTMPPLRPTDWDQFRSRGSSHKARSDLSAIVISCTGIPPAWLSLPSEICS